MHRNGVAKLYPPTPPGLVVPEQWNPGRGNSFGLPHGAFGFQRALARILHDLHPGEHGTIDPHRLPDLTHAEPRVEIPPNDHWFDDESIAGFHALGHRAAFDHLHLLEHGYRFLPTIAVSQSTFLHPGVERQMERGRLESDGKILHPDGSFTVTDINIDPVWNLELVAKRLGMAVMDLRRRIHEETGMFPELLTRPDLHLFQPPIDGPNIHIFGDVSRLADPDVEVGARSHDYCRDGDNFAVRCTCSASKQYAIEELIRIAQGGGIGILVMNPEEGRNHGSVIKHLVYNKRETQPGGDRAGRYFACTTEVAGGEDARMHWLKADPFKWLLPNSRITHWFSESPHKREHLERFGVEIVHQYELPGERIPRLAAVEMLAKHGSGYSGDKRSS